MQYFLEFLSAPVLGTLADENGRKPMFVSAFCVFAVANGLLALSPTIPMVFVTGVLYGLFDSGTPTAYAIISDIAAVRNDPLSSKFGTMSAVTAISFIIGPLLGAYLVDLSIPLAFFVSTIISLLGALCAYVFLEETVSYRKAKALVSWSDVLVDQQVWLKTFRPLLALKVHLSSFRMILLLIPLFITAMNTGLSYTLYMYMSDIIGASATEIGVYLAVRGVLNAVAQAVFLKILVPHYINDEQATLAALIMSGFQRVLLAGCDSVFQLTTINVCTSFASTALASYKTVLVQESLKQPEAENFQATLQGAITSVRTLAMAIGAVIFPAIYSYSISSYSLFYFPQLSFIVSGVSFFVASILLFFILKKDTMLEASSSRSAEDLEKEQKALAKT